MDTHEDITLVVNNNLCVEDKAPSLATMGTQEDITLGVHTKDYAGDNPPSMMRSETVGDHTRDITIKQKLNSLLNKN